MPSSASLQNVNGFFSTSVVKVHREILEEEDSARKLDPAPLPREYQLDGMKGAGSAAQRLADRMNQAASECCACFPRSQLKLTL